MNSGELGNSLHDPDSVSSSSANIRDDNSNIYDGDVLRSRDMSEIPKPDVEAADIPENLPGRNERELPEIPKPADETADIHEILMDGNEKDLPEIPSPGDRTADDQEKMGDIDPEQDNSDVNAEKFTPSEAIEQELQELKESYIDDIVKNSEVPQTINIEKAKSADYEKCSSEETAAKREEFNQQKDALIQQWEKENGQKWPTYENDIYSSNGHLIRRAGDKYDVHHIQPLSMGGKNEVSNITPLHAECHYDRQGVHSANSAYAKLDQKLGA